jgi:hypothetical protein
MERDWIVGASGQLLEERSTDEYGFLLCSDTESRARRVKVVNLAYCDVESLPFACLRDLPSLKKLRLTCTILDDQDLKAIGELRTLEELRISGVKIPDESLRHLGRLRHLRLLEVAGSTVSDAGLRHIGSITTLETLDISRTVATSDGIDCLGSLTRLHTLDAAYTATDGRCAGTIRKLQALRELMLEGTNVPTDVIDGLHRDRPVLRITK